MKPFAMLFRQGTRKLSDNEIQERRTVVRAWAIHLNEEGRKLVPNILGDESYRTPKTEGAEPIHRIGNENDETVAAVTTLQAKDIHEAFKIAQTWPGIRFGGSIEVREVLPIPGPPTE